MKKDVTVTFNVSVEVDETKFTPEFLQIFKEVFYNFDTIEEHIENLAKLKVMDMIEDNFIEGYGKPENMGIKCRIEQIKAMFAELLKRDQEKSEEIEQLKKWTGFA